MTNGDTESMNLSTCITNANGPSNTSFRKVRYFHLIEVKPLSVRRHLYYVLHIVNARSHSLLSDSLLCVLQRLAGESPTISSVSLLSPKRIAQIDWKKPRSNALDNNEHGGGVTSSSKARNASIQRLTRPKTCRRVPIRHMHMLASGYCRRSRRVEK